MTIDFGFEGLNSRAGTFTGLLFRVKSSRRRSELMDI